MMPSPKRIRGSETISDWADIPKELLSAIAKRCSPITDYVSFRGVCTSWRSAATFDNFDREPIRVPWLMRVSRQYTKEGQDIVDIKKVANFFDLSKKKTYKVINVPPAYDTMYLSWSGWLLCVSYDLGDVDAYLTHPVWPIKINLPGLGAFCESTYEGGHWVLPNSISRMVLSDSPTIKTDLVVMVILGNKKQLGFSRPGDSSWTVMDSWEIPFCDIVYHNRRLYALDSTMTVVESDIHGPNASQILQVFTLPEFIPFLPFPVMRVYYLVESSGKILIVSRHIHNNVTDLFQVIELDLMNGSHKRIDDLGNRALFVGSNSSVSVELSAWDDGKPNSIYFTDHSMKSRGFDTGVCCLFDMTVELFPYGCAAALSAPPTWVLPSF